MEQFKECNHHPLTLVSAPAGYGKSTVVSSWLDECDLPHSWLSLDDGENDLRSFLSYFLFAVQKIFSDAVAKTMILVNAPNLPSLTKLANSLANELDAIERKFILVLDDVHHIREKSVHDFLDILLKHPPLPMRMVIIGRRDPFLSVPALRAQGRLFEIRLNDLRFTEDETAAYLQQLFNKPVDHESAVAWTEKTEGWVTGLRLAALSMKHRGEYKSLLPELQGGTQYVMEYLFSEILSRQSTDVRNYLLKTSILDRFCAPLCESLGGNGDESDGDKSSCWQLISLLKHENLFIISLDAEGYWYRFHHLFQELLQRQLKRDQSSKEIAELHLRASQWYESEGLIRESIKHALAAGDSEHAAEIVERYQHSEIAADRWYVVQQWIGLLPFDLKQVRPKLILTATWIEIMQHQFTQVLKFMKQAELIIDDRISDVEVLGEIAFLRGYVMYFNGQAEGSLRNLKEAVQLLSGKKTPFLAEAELMLGLARCMTGQKDMAIGAFKARASETVLGENYLLSRLIAGLSFIYLVCGDLLSVRVEAKRLLLLSREHNMLLTKAWSYYFLACSYLHCGELEAALLHFTKTVDLRYMLEPRAAVDAMAGLALTQQLMGLKDDATESWRQLQTFAAELNGENYFAVARSCHARLSVFRDEAKSVLEWSRSGGESPLPAELFTWLEAPSITQARVLIAGGSEDDQVRALQLLRAIQKQCEVASFTGQTIEISILQPLALYKLRRTDEAIHALKKGVALAAPHGWVRPFIEAGPVMAEMLNRLRKHNVSVDFIDNLLSAFPEREAASPQTGLRPSNDDQEVESGTGPPIPDSKPDIHRSLVEPLTIREIEVLELLAQRLQNKEIASKLSVSPTTVKTHLQHIYQKLCTNNRRKAVETAEALGILSRR
jgi:LuxR family maltose regulon positive regulatory protein